MIPKTLKHTICALALTTSLTHAATVTFDDEFLGNNGYFVDDNWDTNAFPTATDDAIIGAPFTSSVNNAAVVTLTTGTILIQSGASFNINTGSSIRLSSNGGVSVTIQGTLNVNGNSFLSSNQNNSGGQNTFLLDGGVMNIADWTNTLRSFGSADGDAGWAFNQAGDTINISGITDTEETNYNSKFALNFFGIQGEIAAWTTTANGRESQIFNGLQLVRTDDFANDSSTVTLIAVPEPSSTALLGLGGLALILRRKK